VSGRVGQAGPLNKERIVRAALRVVQRDGVELLSMRRVADEIGTAPMSLYRHVTDKRELLLALLDLAMRDLLSRLPADAPEPRQRLIDTVHNAYRTILAHRWSVQAILAVGELPPSALLLSEYLLTVMYEAGLDERTAAYAHTAIWHYTWGHLTLGHLSAASARAFDARGPESRAALPALARTVSSLREVAGRDAFLVGLAALVDGFLTAA